MTRIQADWLRDPALQALLAALSAGGEEARVVGGAIRNTLMDRPISDVDVATTTLPAETIARVEAAGLRAVPTGIEHGTVTVVAEGRPFEVTTLRRDVETDGRHAKVLFGRDWALDAGRRDFTINALYCDAQGQVLDFVGGIADVGSGTLRFIGDAGQRIEEDYLRILRFFRFFAWYGHGRPDGEGLRACSRLKEGLDRLSAERVWGELRKVLGAPEPARALLWMRQAGVLGRVLPESEKWGIDAIHGLVDTERLYGWAPDPIRRLEAVVPPDAARLRAMAGRLRLSNADRDRIVAWAMAEMPLDEGDGAFRARLYLGDRSALSDRLSLALAAERTAAAQNPDRLAQVARLAARHEAAVRFDPPPFPLSGHDLAAAGIGPGPEVGRTLDRLKRSYAESGFVLGRDALLKLV
ncbi:CCA tRNA nucleotidyltransferase [Aureimonas flava]|uniref:CCA tRNA nucleotidyltransferase n=1 Tax=Aureimonas flava TaxID=2320271 RepID=A0A3A1WLC3_9HYPH|nr:CCA tRNA nucleotidyltransferase [Aureimonas flava]RIY02108.1 CCA tRNA nucleotidyltransferase [Aureimonas flava]